ncbi:MAG: zinc ribbon domain-containing protein [Bdellovibrionales bacterium]|nr:zinc ribbon domain-containing protein [Bdellovibrionales bacterium]
MKPKCESCNSCGMPLESKEDFALGDTSSVYCKYCVDNVGQLLPYDTILKNNAHYYKESQGLTEQAATKMAKDLLKTLPAWKNVGV